MRIGCECERRPGRGVRGVWAGCCENGAERRHRIVNLTTHTPTRTALEGKNEGSYVLVEGRQRRGDGESRRAPQKLMKTVGGNAASKPEEEEEEEEETGPEVHNSTSSNACTKRPACTVCKVASSSPCWVRPCSFSSPSFPTGLLPPSPHHPHPIHHSDVAALSVSASVPFFLRPVSPCLPTSQSSSFSTPQKERATQSSALSRFSRQW